MVLWDSMSSMDFIYDLTDKLDEQSIEYCLCALRSGNQQDKVDVFYNISTPETRKEIALVLNQISRDLNEKTDDEIIAEGERQLDKTDLDNLDKDLGEEEEDDDDFFNSNDD